MIFEMSSAAVTVFAWNGIIPLNLTDSRADALEFISGMIRHGVNNQVAVFIELSTAHIHIWTRTDQLQPVRNTEVCVDPRKFFGVLLTASAFAAGICFNDFLRSDTFYTPSVVTNAMSFFRLVATIPHPPYLYYPLLVHRVHPAG